MPRLTSISQELNSHWKNALTVRLIVSHSRPDCAERKSWSVGTSRSEQHAETAASVARRIFEPPLLVGYALRLAVSFRRMQQ